MSYTCTDLDIGQILFTVIGRINLEWVHLATGWDTGDGTSTCQCQLTVGTFFICGNYAGNLCQFKLISLEGNMILVRSNMSWAKNVHRNSYCGSADLQQHCSVSESSVPIWYFLSPGKTKEMKEHLWYVTNISETNPETTSDTDFILSILSGSCFDELIQNPDLSHLWHVDAVLNWTLPVMCKFTSDSAINISGSEWSLTRFSLTSASLISVEKELLASESYFSV